MCSYIIARRTRICNFYIFSKVINELISPSFVFIDNASYLMIKQRQLFVYMQSRTVLRLRYFRFYRLDYP